ncbi:MAG TPA: protease pro-enzyme activation domain-containing protein, partial [Candidatus Binatia bacterium]|nr:protease pro-enzyme activation domain-containing protein [Candidatus Binatia bacterium]
MFASTLVSTLSVAQADRITVIGGGQRIPLSGSLRRNAKPQYDQGRVAPSFQLNHVTLLTLPTPAQQQALKTLVVAQQNPKSPSFHKWLTPAQWADQFGLSQNDVQKITGWLKSQGLTVTEVAQGRNWISFSGSAAQLESAFQTEFHRYSVNGEMHFANAVPPSIPAALSGIAAGFRGMDDFHPKPAYVRTPQQRARANYYDGSYIPPDFVAPGDIAAIYDVQTLYNDSPAIDGTGQKLAIVGQTDVYLADLNAFRNGFQLPAINGCTTNSADVITACNTSNFVYVLDGADPGVAPPTRGDVTEADLDLEWSAATARGAQIIFVNSTDVFHSFYYAIDHAIAPIISMSYGAPCEFDENSLPSDEVELTKANSLGITFMNSSGDSGAASCDGTTNSSTQNLAIGGLAVSYPASSPEVTGVGGTAITYPSGFDTQYWSQTSGAYPNGGTAQDAPLPETAWNDDVELTLLAGGTPLSVQQSYAIVSSGGGISNCSVQTSDFSNCVSGFPQPSWQTVTIPGQAPGRFVPDVSLLASPNFPGYVYCTPIAELATTSQYASDTSSSCGAPDTPNIQDAVNGICSGGACNGNNTVLVGPSLVGGTSASSPIFAGIVALLNQYLGANGLGNINPMLYTLATTSSAFRPATSGNNIVYCEGAQPPAPWPVALQCPGPEGSTGSFGYQASNADPTTGYNLVTGLGSVDVNDLLVAWKAASRTATSVSLASSTNNVTIGTSVTLTATLTPSTGTGAVSFSTLNSGTTTNLGTVTVNYPYPPSTTGTAVLSTAAMPPGTNSVTATYEGDASHAAATSSATSVTVTTPFTMSANPSSLSVPAGQSAIYPITVTPVGGFTGTVNFTNSTSTNAGSCPSGLPAGALCVFSPPSVTLDGVHTQSVTLTITTAANMALPSGPQTVTVTGASGTANVPMTVSLTVSATNESFTVCPPGGCAITPPTYAVTVGASATVNLAITGMGSPISFVTNSTTALNLTYTCTGSPSLTTSEITCQLPNNGQPTNAASVSVTLVTTPATSELRRPL